MNTLDSDAYSITICGNLQLLIISDMYMHVDVGYHVHTCIFCLSVCLVQDASVDVLHGFVEHLELEDTEAQGRLR